MVGVEIAHPATRRPDVRLIVADRLQSLVHHAPPRSVVRALHAHEANAAALRRLNVNAVRGRRVADLTALAAVGADVQEDIAVLKALHLQHLIGMRMVLVGHRMQHGIGARVHTEVVILHADE